MVHTVVQRDVKKRKTTRAHKEVTEGRNVKRKEKESREIVCFSVCQSLKKTISDEFEVTIANRHQINGNCHT